VARTVQQTFAWSVNRCYGQPVEKHLSGGSLKTNKKFSGDVVPLSDLKVNPDRVISQSGKTHRPMLLTSRGRGVAAVPSVKDNEADAEGRAFIKAVAQGFVDVEQGRTVQARY